MMERVGGRSDHVAAIGSLSGRDRPRPRGQWLHEMRSDLGRLDAIAEILQVGPSLRRAWLRDPGDGILRRNAGSISMRVFRAAAVIALLTGPAYAQMPTPNINLIPEVVSKTPEEKEQEAAQQKAYKESLKKIPDAKVSSDPWGSVRGAETPKTPAAGKPRTKTGSTSN